MRVTVVSYIGQTRAGNTCYVSTSLRLLASVDCFLDFLSRYPTPCTQCQSAALATCPVHAIRDYLTKLSSPCSSERSTPLQPPPCLISALGVGDTQHDPDEFVLAVLGKMVNAHCRGISAEDSVVFSDHLAFWSSCSRSVKCPNACDGEQLSTTLIVEGVVDVWPVDGVSINDLIYSYASRSHEHDVRCEICGEKRHADVSYAMYAPPMCLFINLQRVNFYSGRLKKNNNHVDFLSDIDLGQLLPPLSEATKRAFTEAGGVLMDGVPVVKLSLRAFTVHSGASAHSGHHVAFANLPSTSDPHSVRAWFRCDDTAVDKVDSQVVRSQNAQLLVYVASNPVAVAALRSTAAQFSAFRTLAQAWEQPFRATHGVSPDARVPGVVVEDESDAVLCVKDAVRTRAAADSAPFLSSEWAASRKAHWRKCCISNGAKGAINVLLF